jgi:hypothetical protein
LRWIACWPLLLCIYLAGFLASEIMADMMLQTVMRMHWSRAVAISPILADILHMLIVLPAISFLVPSHQHFVVFGFAVMVGIASPGGTVHPADRGLSGGATGLAVILPA